MMQILLAINGETCHVIRKPFFFFQDANCDGRLVKKDDREIFFFFCFSGKVILLYYYYYDKFSIQILFTN